MIRPCFLPFLALAVLPALSPAATPVASPRLPEVLVTGTGLNENLPADQTGRPDWTSARRFPTTRVYLQQAPWEIGFEQWLRFRDRRDGTSQLRFQEEIEIGLPYRMQLDIYEKWTSDEHRNADHDELSFELRYALADWGKIPLNPTLYAEYALVNHDANVFEVKLLLGENITPRLHWGLNFSFEHSVGGERASEFLIAQGFSYTIIDELLSAGVEMEYIRETVHGGRGEAEEQILLGPSVQIRPTKNTHFDLVGLVGLNGDAPNLEFFAIFGIEFGRIGGSEQQGYKPASLHGR